MKALRSWLGGTPAAEFPYTIGEELVEWKRSQDCGQVWALHEATRTADNEKVCVFVLDKTKSSQYRIDAAKNCMSKLKTTRHPNILPYQNGIETDDKIYIATDYVLPLSASIDHIGNAQAINDGFIAVGLHQIATALSFVHNSLGMIHGRIDPASIFVNKSGDWYLGGFEIAHNYGQLPAHFSSNFDLLPTRYKPKEFSNSGTNVQALTNNPIHSLDAWCLGCVICETFNGRFSKPQELSQLGKIPKDLQAHYKRLLATKATSRLATKAFLESPFFRHPLVKTVTFLDEIAIKSDAEKASFLKNLDSNINSFPRERCKYRILPALIHVLEHGSGSNPVLFSCVLKISQMLDESEHQKYILPSIINLFKNNDRGTRNNLLKNMDKYIDMLDSKTISKEIYPSIESGFNDSTPILREATVRAVLHFAPKLDTKTLHDRLLTILLKLQSQDPEPAIRTNTTIVLGKIANLLNMAQCEKQIVDAFHRAITDAFTPLRQCGISAFAATIGYYSPKMLATRVIPLVCTKTIDPYKSVRDQAFKCIETGLQRLQQHALTMPEKPATVAPPGAAAANGNAASDGTGGGGSGSDTSANTAASVAANALNTVGSWAASTISTTLSKSNLTNNNNNNNDGGSNIGELKTKPRTSASSYTSNNSTIATTNNNNSVSGSVHKKQKNGSGLRTEHRSKDRDEVDDIFSPKSSNSSNNNINKTNMDDFFNDIDGTTRDNNVNNNNNDDDNWDMSSDDGLSFSTKTKSKAKSKGMSMNSMNSMNKNKNDDIMSNANTSKSSKNKNKKSVKLDELDLTALDGLGLPPTKNINNNNDTLDSLGLGSITTTTSTSTTTKKKKKDVNSMDSFLEDFSKNASSYNKSNTNKSSVSPTSSSTSSKKKHSKKKTHTHTRPKAKPKAPKEDNDDDWDW